MEKEGTILTGKQAVIVVAVLVVAGIITEIISRLFAVGGYLDVVVIFFVFLVTVILLKTFSTKEGVRWRW